MVTTDAAAKALVAAKGIGTNSFATQTVGSVATPTGAAATVSATAYGGHAATVDTIAAAKLTTNQLLIVGY